MFGLMGLVGGWLIWKWAQKDMSLLRNYRQLVASGFTESYFVRGTFIIVVDKSKRELAMVFYNGVRRYRFEQIDSWRYEWETRNGVRTNDRLVINVLDPDSPSFVLRRLSSRECEQWHGRLNALVNG